ncbi:unnamed protein product [Calypogeia fissa]
MKKGRMREQKKSKSMLSQNSESLTPSPSPSPSASASVSVSGSSQKRKRNNNDELTSTSGGVVGVPSYSAHPSFNSVKPYSSMLSLDNHELADNLLHSQHDEHDPTAGGGGSKNNSQNHSQFESMNGAIHDPEREEFEDDEEDEAGDDAEEDGEEEDDDEAEEDVATQSSTPRVETAASQRPSLLQTVGQQQQLINVKAEPATEVSREVGSPAPISTVSNPASAVSNDVKPSPLSGTIQTSGAYCSREEILKKEEDSGRLRFVCHSNDGVDKHMIWLIGLKNIFSRQLPNMPKEYIVRLVMDRSHKSMMILKNNNVVGGITYRPYVNQKFGEIAFCAITADEQVKGFGTRLMNHLKQYARETDGLTHFLTYADNNAVGYFTKQGFTKEIEMEKERWQGYIKDYDGGTLMECKIDPKFPYIDLPAMIRRQRQAIHEKIRELSNCHVVHPGIEKKEAGVLRRPLRIEDIPGVKEAGWAPEQSGLNRIRLVNSTSEGPPSRQSLNAFMRSLLKVVVEHADAWPFKEPVDAREVPDYYEVIKDPVDLRTLSKRLESEQFFVTLEMFAADMRRMFSNARTYNSPDTIYYKAAKRLETFFNNKLHAGIQGSNRSHT